MFTNHVPYIISIAFLIAIIIPVFMINSIIKRATGNSKPIIPFYITYFIVVSILCFQGVFNTETLPPRIIVVTTLPLLLFYIFYISNTKFYKSFLDKVALPDLVKIHIFRLIGGFFLILFFLDQLPATFAFIAGCGDIITALSSLYVAKIIKESKTSATPITIVWNTFGLIDILVTSATAVFLTKMSIETGSMGVDILTQFPFCLIPAFAPATIIFLHITIYRKILNQKKQPI